MVSDGKHRSRMRLFGAAALIELLMVVAGSFFGISVSYADSGVVQRVAGDTRYDTMSGLVDRVGGWKSSSTVVLTSGSNYPDALSASALAGVHGAPIVLTEPNWLSDQATAVIKKLAPSNVIVVGGSSAIGDNVLVSVRKITGRAVWRIAGSTRYDTSISVMNSCGSSSNTVVIATGTNYADSLAISPYSYATKSPIVLCDPQTGLSQSALSAVKSKGFSKAILVGGNAAVPNIVVSQLARVGITSENVRRLSGDTRYETSIQVAAFELSQSSVFSCKTLGFATGPNFADALAMGPCVGKRGAPLLLVDPGSSIVCGYIKQFKGKTNAAYVAGGINAVSSGDYKNIQVALTPDVSIDPKPTLVSLSGARVEVTQQTYTGSALRPAPTVTLGGRTLVQGTDYTVSYSNNVQPGTATVTVTGKGNYTGTATGTFKIVKPSPAVKTAVDVPSARQLVYNGSYQEAVSSGERYSVRNGGGTSAGTYSATLTLKDKEHYKWPTTGKSDDVSVSWSISAASLSGARVEVPQQTYTGSALRPAPTVTLGGRTLEQGTDYTISYSDNVQPGIATVTVTGKGNYTGTATGTFKISMGSASVRKVKVGDVTVSVYTYPDGYSYVDVPEQWVSINSCLNTTRCLEVAGSSKDNGANVRIWDDNGLTSQIWKFVKVSDGVYRVVNAYSNQVLDLVEDQMNKEGGNVLQWPKNGGDNQLWRAEVYSGKLMLLNVHSGRALDCNGGFADCGTNIQVWGRNNGNGQLFELGNASIITKGQKTIYVGNTRVTQVANDNGDRYYEIPEGMYTVTSDTGSNKVLDVAWGSKDDGANVETWSNTGANWQKWNFVRQGNGIYRIESVNSGKCLEIAGQDSGVNGGNVRQWSYASGWNNKLWKLWLTKDNRLMFLNLQNYRALNVSGGSAGDGTNVNALDRDNSRGQTWILTSTTKKIDPNEECQRINQEVFDWVNEYRRRNGLSVLGQDGTCINYALQSVNYCARIGQLKHGFVESLGSNRRYSDCLYRSTFAPAGKDIVNGWINSTVHHQQLNCPSADVCGVQTIYSNGYYYVSWMYHFTGNTNVGDLSGGTL